MHPHSNSTCDCECAYTRARARAIEFDLCNLTALDLSTRHNSARSTGATAASFAAAPPTSISRYLPFLLSQTWLSYSTSARIRWRVAHLCCLACFARARAFLSIVGDSSTATRATSIWRCSVSRAHSAYVRARAASARRGWSKVARSLAHVRHSAAFDARAILARLAVRQVRAIFRKFSRSIAQFCVLTLAAYLRLQALRASFHSRPQFFALVVRNDHAKFAQAISIDIDCSYSKPKRCWRHIRRMFSTAHIALKKTLTRRQQSSQCKS